MGRVSNFPSVIPFENEDLRLDKRYHLVVLNAIRNLYSDRIFFATV